MIGVAVEAAWIGAHIALYPLGLIEDKLEDATNHGVAHLPPAHRGLIVGDVEAAGTPIILVHGVIDNRSIFTVLRRSLRRRGFGRTYALNYSPLIDDLRDDPKTTIEKVYERFRVDIEDEEADKALLEGLEAVHSQEVIQRKAFPDPTEEQLAHWGVGAVPEKTHPVVWHHRSGRKSLILANTIDHFVGMERAESDVLLARLLRMADEPRYIYTHDWQVGDMLIWDNTGTMHRVVPFDNDCGRELHRTTLVGEEPIAAPR